MKDKQLKKLKNFVIGDISEEEYLEECQIDESVNNFKGFPMFNELTDEDFERVANEIKSEFSIHLDVGTLIEEKKHEKWFLDKKRVLDMKYWERYKRYLLLDKKFSTRVVNTMDDILDTLTDLLGDPDRDIKYNRRGLIIGDVQSGKTANYIGLMCKAADAGYKVIVLLTGTIEKLRQQTQQRVDEGFVGMDSDAMMKQQDDGFIIGVGKYDSSVIRPMVLTSTTDDFKQKNATNLNFDLENINGPVVFVVKKNSAVLRRLNKWLTTYNKNGEQPIDHSLLMIDDEADNASINTKTEDNPTAINAQLRIMLNSFKKSSYVGFTATPFANIFIDSDLSDDLFPKDYVYSLNAPSNYIGARNIFNDDGEYNTMLVSLDDDPENKDGIAYILPLKHKSEAWITRIPYDLKTAIRTFLLANTVEDLRGKNDNHRSMLINISRFRGVQGCVAELVNAYLKNLQHSCKLYSALGEDALEDENIQDLKETYETIYANIEFSWDIIQSALYSSCANIQVQLFNQDSGQNFSFDSFPSGARVIAVGGMSLSRGLTLEGLVISYFYRNSKMYDTLMQMGRWFGYRGGYGDLCRIWMTEESIEWYKYISEATDELREEVKSYEDSGLTPKDFGLRVRSDLATLIVTAANKMKSADSRECLVSLSGETIETPELYLESVKNQENKNEVEKFVELLNTSGFKVSNFARQKNKYVSGFYDIPKINILDLIEHLEISPKNVHFNVKSISQFIRNYKGPELNKWDVVFATGSSDIEYDLGNGITGKCKNINYSIENNGKIIKISGSKRRIGTNSDGKFGLTEEEIKEVKDLSQKENPAQKQYFRRVNRKPLLIIYYIELKDLIGDASEENKVFRDSIQNEVYVGFGIGIPKLSDIQTRYVKYTLNKVAIQNMFEDELDEWNEEEDGDEY